MKHSRREEKERGFAMLFVFAMASIIAITLYVALPRITFEAQRDKEELLISRGEQYKRAIQLYVHKFKRFPAKMEDLDNANGVRFLRHHYKDPMTGKDEWRLIHAGPGGVLLDSLVQKQTDKDKKFGTQSSITELQGVGGPPEADANVNIALRKRPSDQQAGTGGEGTGTAPPGAPIPADPPQGVVPGSSPSLNQGAVPGTIPGQLPGAISGIGNAVNPVTGTNASGQSAAGTALPGRLPATPNAAGSAVNSQTGGISAATSFGPAAPVPGQTPVPTAVTQQLNNPAAAGAIPNAQGATDAAKLIQGLLTTPRPGGLAGLQNNAGGQTIGGGIAGVASTIKTGSGIKIYNEQDEYKKWEFVFDAAKEAQAASGIPQLGKVPGTPLGQQPAGQQPAGAVGGGVFGQPPFAAPATPPK